MDFSPITLEGFSGRAKELAAITRFSDPTLNMFPVMFYRTNDFIHSQRVLWHLEDMMPDIVEVYPAFRVNYGRTLGFMHDDCEIRTGDPSLHSKEQMTLEEASLLAQREEDAVAWMVGRYGPVANGFSYADLLLDAKSKASLEAQFVSFCDKFDGFGEACHEVWAGNMSFALPAGGRNGSSGGYVRRLNDFVDRYPLMRPFFAAFPHYLPGPFDFRAVEGSPHTKQSLFAPTGYAPYDRWKSTVIAREMTRGNLVQLTAQVEFCHPL